MKIITGVLCGHGQIERMHNTNPNFDKTINRQTNQMVEMCTEYITNYEQYSGQTHKEYTI